MASHSLIKICCVISLCIHLGLGFFPFFSTPQNKFLKDKFVEVILLNKMHNKYSYGLNKEAVRNHSNSLRIPVLAADKSRGKNYQKSNSIVSKITGWKSQEETVSAVEHLELDLSGCEEKSSSSLTSNYAYILRSCILKKISYPKSAFAQNVEGTVQIRFVLLPDGNLKDVYVVNSSNSPILDVAAVAAIEKANPFPPFPENLRAKELFVKVPIVYKLN